MHFMTLVYGDNVDQQLEPYAFDQENYFLEPLRDIRDKNGGLTFKEVKSLILGTLRTRDLVVVVNEDDVYQRDGQLLHPYIEDLARFPCTILTCNEKGELKKKTYVDTMGKWDWFEVGGRWSDHFNPLPTVKDSYKAYVVTPFQFGLTQEKQDRTVLEHYPSLLKKDIDVEKIFNQTSVQWAVEEALMIQRLVDGEPFKVLSEIVSQDTAEDVAGEAYKTARDRFLRQAPIKRVKEYLEEGGVPEDQAVTKILFLDFLSAEYLTLPPAELEKVTREKALVGACSLREGEWVEEKGIALTTSLSVHREKMRHWNEASEDEWVTVVDCHC